MADPVPATGEEIALAIARGALFTALAVVLACVAVRWVLPLILRVLKRPVQDLIQVVAACVVLPDYWASRATRRITGGPPPMVVYEYGYTVGWIARVAHNVIGRTFAVLATIASSVHPAAVAVAAGAVEISLLMGWL